MTALLEVEALEVDFPRAAGTLHAVRDVSFTLDRGETLGIVGESGCGKSLTSLALMGLLPRTARRRAATLRFGGHDLGELDERRMADMRGRPHGDDLPGADDLAQSGLHDRQPA